MDINFLDNQGYKVIYTKAQRDLVVEYRTMHPEFSDLSDAEIALMNPVSPEVFNLYASNALLSIDNELQDIYEEKKENKRLFKTNYHDSDINNDIVALNIRENELYTFKNDILLSIKKVSEAYETRER